MCKYEMPFIFIKMTHHYLQVGNEFWAVAQFIPQFSCTPWGLGQGPGKMTNDQARDFYCIYYLICLSERFLLFLQRKKTKLCIYIFFYLTKKKAIFFINFFSLFFCHFLSLIRFYTVILQLFKIKQGIIGVIISPKKKILILVLVRH